MQTKDLGFDGDQVLLAIQFKGDLDALQIERLANEINSRPGLVQGVTGCLGGHPDLVASLPCQSGPMRKY